jgi:hypothetical protein
MRRTDIEREFDKAMMNIYHQAKSEAGYNATHFLQMLQKHRGLKTARFLLHAPTFPMVIHLSGNAAD